MADMKKPLGLYLEPHGFWKIDKVIRGERIRLCTQTSNLAEAKEILGRYVRGHSRRHLQTAWETTVEGMLRDRKSWLHRTAHGLSRAPIWAWRKHDAFAGCRNSAALQRLLRSYRNSPEL